MKKEKHPVCEEARACYYDFLTGEAAIPDRIREHIEICSECRGEVDRLRRELEPGRSCPSSPMVDMLALQASLFDRWISCTQTKPFLAVFSGAGCAPGVMTPITAHIEHCPDCRKELEILCSLHLNPSQAAAAGRFLAGDSTAEAQIEPEVKNVLSDMQRRPDSGILTQMRLDEKTGDFVTTLAKERAGSGTSGGSKIGPLIRRSAVAAAVLLFAFIFICRTPEVKGLDLNEVYRALGNVLNVTITSYGTPNDENVSITSYGLEETEPIQQIWISNALDIQLYVEKDRAILWDLAKKQRIVKTSTGQEILPISHAVKKLEIPWGLLPVRNISNLPAGYRWKVVQDPQLQKEPDTIVYDLIWTDPLFAGKTMERKWRGYLNAYTKLPYQVEWWDKLPGQEFKKITMTLISYPKNDEVLSQIRTEGFDYLPADQR